MSFIDWYNSEAIKIWHAFESQYKFDKMPLLLGKYNQEAEVLIVGMNPSFNQPAMDRYFSSESANPMLKGYTSEKLFKWQGYKERIEIVKKWELIASEEYKTYFGQFGKLINECGFNDNSWAHLDLFLMRGTNQNEELKLIYENKNKINDFGKNQIKLLLNAIDRNKHKLVIIFNARASEIISEAIGNKEFQTQFLFKNKVFFFCSMLTNGRLDRFSRERLIKEIKDYKIANF